jgi:YD repeat-containing protein
LASVSLGNSQIVSFTYNQDNQLQTQTTSNGTTLTLGYDNVGRETKRSYKTSSNNILFSSTLTYDKNSNIIKEQIVKNNQAILKEYAYDSKDQIKSFAQTENSYRAKTNSYSYDKASNIIEKILEDNVAHSNEQIYKEVNEDNQYTSIKSNSSNVTISYDANGNIKTYKDKTFTYDFLNRLTVSNSYDVVDRIESATLSGGSNNDLLLMLQASEIANTFIKSENVQNIMNDPSNRFASNDNVQVFQSYIGNQSKFTERKTIFCVCKDIYLKSLKDCFV